MKNNQIIESIVDSVIKENSFAEDMRDVIRISVITGATYAGMDQDVFNAAMDMCNE